MRRLLLLSAVFVLVAGSAHLVTAGADEARTRVLVQLTGGPPRDALDHVLGELAGAEIEPTHAAGYGGGCPGGSTSATGPGAAAPCTYATVCAHGTHVAGIAVGRRPAGSTVGPRQGVAPGAALAAVQIFSSDGSGGAGATDSDILA